MLVEVVEALEIVVQVQVVQVAAVLVVALEIYLEQTVP
jgi:hypothetical protein